MHSPAHPGEVLREPMGEMSVSRLASHLGLSRMTPELWLNMRTQFDLWQASRRKRKRVAPLVAA
jgi:antitoxin HigA-1